MKKIGVSVVVLVLFLTNLVFAGDGAKVAVAAKGKTATAEVSGVAARSPYFLIFDGDGRLLEAVENPYKAAKGDAGTSVVPFLAQKGVTLVVAGEFGEKMIQAMKAQGIEYLEFHGSAEGALKKVLEARK
ncbi:MAG: NifB/NifX family molybdenum-iron cluster-binding protein [Pseudomonadota bacterium]